MSLNMDFPRQWLFLKSVPSLPFLPPEGPAEIAFAGRSNVGKSSLINALTQQKSLARTSNTPGRTQELNYFIPETPEGQLPLFALVDMPGYGFAQAPKTQVEQWIQLIFNYLRGRRTLKRVYLLIDARHGIKKNDQDAMALLDKAAVSYQLILTKIDKIPQKTIQELEKTTKDILRKHPASYPEILMTSSEKMWGIKELQTEIMQTLA